MEFNNLLLEISDSIAVITLNRPKQLNALNKETIAELHQALEGLKNDAEVRVVILTGSGEKSFVAGADIKEFANFSVTEGTELAALGQTSLFDYIENYSKPVIAAVNGFALGGGLELAMSAHIRIASNNAKLGLPEVTLGLIPGYGGTQRLAQLVGKGRALEMILSAQMIKADRAYEMGLVNHLTELDELLPTAKGLAAKIAQNSPNAIHSAIKCVNAGYTDGMNGFKVEIEEFGKCFGTEDFTEGTTAFLEKRKPQF
ncbi:enoyl-CoA hydratase-related protein [Croceimicrobium hydrocarbonivorans]|uniref:Enoyl-CoA hydratase/isomerase family protein n=1 Tax=Croceimicrobium hydrocarbonivorans TaxID=2761580 RepID=A0A7H0VJI0_9FLAO|nr:enoyl-CoA hydratase-related protein [Croceimicrobium hydrocarbonivorans]QNR25878.1 enoyl-CoA hydratase/isomerase family protein [Croceimicrobium hydrocarbonivorans]